MEQIEPIQTTREAILPISHGEPRWDPEKASKRKVRVLKVPHGEDPMEEKTIFEFGGFVYICYSVKTRGRYMIRCLGLADVERPSEKQKVPFESGKLLDEATKELDDATFEDSKADLALDDEGSEKVSKDIRDKMQLEKVLNNLNLAATKGLSADAFDDAISGDGIKDAIDKDVIDKVVKEAIDDEAVNKVVKDILNTMEKEKEAEGDGQSSLPDQIPKPGY